MYKLFYIFIILLFFTFFKYSFTENLDETIKLTFSNNQVDLLSKKIYIKSDKNLSFFETNIDNVSITKLNARQIQINTPNHKFTLTINGLEPKIFIDGTDSQYFKPIELINNKITYENYILENNQINFTGKENNNYLIFIMIWYLIHNINNQNLDV